MDRQTPDSHNNHLAKPLNFQRYLQQNVRKQSFRLSLIGFFALLTTPFALAARSTGHAAQLQGQATPPLSIIEPQSVPSSPQPTPTRTDMQANGQDSAGSSSGSGSSSNSSSTQVTVNGQALPVPANGTTQQTIISNNGSTKLNVSIHHSQSSSGSSTSQQSSSQLNVSSDSDPVTQPGGQL